MCVIYIVEQNVKVSSSYVYHRLYFTQKLKNSIIKTHRKSRRYPLQITLPCPDIIVPPLYSFLVDYPATIDSTVMSIYSLYP